MDISRSGFYKWKKRIKHPSPRELSRLSNVQLFIEYHKKYPSHGYRWLNAKIRLDTGLILTDNYAFKCCHYAGIRSTSRHARYKCSHNRPRVFPNLLLAGICPDRPFKVIVSDMTAFKIDKTFYELTFYMDLFNNEIVAYGLAMRRGDTHSYYDGLKELIGKKEEYSDLELTLHTDQGSVYSSKAFNDLLLLHNITHSMSNAGCPTENGAMEAINGWVKEELFIDFNIRGCKNVPEFIKKYVKYFNEERPAYSLGYLTPRAYREMYGSKRV